MLNVHTIVNSVFKSKTYILTEVGNNEAWLIDCGDNQPIIDYINAKELILRGIFITHTHFDHIY